MKKTAVVLDTSIFVNPDARIFFGKSVEEALGNFLDRLRNKKNISCYIPPSVYKELTLFIKNAPPAKKTILINKKPPSFYQTPIPALLLYEFIEEFRLRLNKGLRVAEKYTRKAIKMHAETGREEEETGIIKNLREEYRAALREGIVDSKQDFDLILLAKELDAYLATQDFGLIHWAHKLGITCIDAKELKELTER